MNRTFRSNSEQVAFIRNRKITTILSVFIIFIFVIIVRLFYLQINQNKKFSLLGEKNFLRTEMLPSRRGNLLDCHGNLLATNSPVFDLYWKGTGKKRFSENQFAVVKKVSDALQTEIDTKKIMSVERYSKRFLLKKNIDFEELCCVSEQCADSKNLFVEKHFKRVYPYDSLASHIVGYLGRIDCAALVGRSGLERFFESKLHGESGYISHITNAKGKKIIQTDLKDAKAGDDIQLTLDLDLQYLCEGLFKPDQSGVIVLMDPETGAVRACVSHPNFDPNLFLDTISIKDWNEQFSKNSPFLNRVINATYPPASIFKLVTFITGLEEGVISPETFFNCRGHTLFCGRKHNRIRRWGHGKLSAEMALAKSCNIPCYEIAQKISVDHFAQYAYSLGLGMKTGFLFEEKAGIVPSTRWKQAYKGERWWSGETLHVSIGQSYLLVTPLQVARMISGLCMGYLVKPRILESENTEIDKLYISEPTMTFIRDTMGMVVQKGTARILNKHKDLRIFAKTGTAQTVSLKKQKESKEQLEHAWFGSYFYDKNNKPLTLIVLVEHAGRAYHAVKIADDFLTAYQKRFT